MDVKLVMFKSNGQRKDIAIASPVTVVGRGESCDLRVPLMSVSRNHCEIRNENDSLTVKDLGSSNGTYVNNKRINEETVSAGDRLVIGPVVFTVQIDGEPEEIRPVKTRAQRIAEQGAGAEGLDEVVDLEAQDGDDEDIDPIAALEALAGSDDEDDEDE
jgi:pSer/pThr/pTyr-binding forkhead associated (FHA) protein